MLRLVLFPISSVALLMCMVTQLFAADLLRSKYGAPLKVILRHDTAVFAEADRASRSQPLRQFEFFFCLKADESGEKTKNGFYRVATGPSESYVVGWINEADVVEWPHAQVLGFAKRAGREPAFFFEGLQELQKYMADGTTSDAISREPAGVELRALLPILSESEIEVSGEKMACYEMAYLHSGDALNTRSDQSADVISLQEVKKELTLNLCFVIDTTNSMAKYISAAKEVIRKIAAAVNANQNLRGRVRLALVGYRDTGDEYVSKVLCTLEQGSDLKAFESALASTEAAGGGDDPEQVNAGVLTALKELNWDDYASKHIVLIGDAPNQEGEKSLVDLPTVLAAAQPPTSSSDVTGLFQHKTIHTLMVGDRSEEAGKLAVKQFEALAGNTFAGAMSDGTDVAKFSDKLVEILTRRMADVSNTVKGDIEKVIKSPNVGALGAILEYLGKEKIVGDTFAHGYTACSDAKGNRTVEPYALVGRNDLRSYKSAVEFCVTLLEGAGEPGSKDVAKILSGLKNLTLDTQYPIDITPDTPLKEVLQLILGLPVKASIFDMTPDRLAGMAEEDFQAWVAEINACQSIVAGHLENSHWFNLGRETKPELRYAFIRISDLP